MSASRHLNGTHPVGPLWRLDPQPPVSLESRVLTACDVAELLCVPVSTVYELARRELLPCLRIGRAIRFSRTDLEEHLSAHRGTG
jgi:excisionase family DNA binding protein